MKTTRCGPILAVPVLASALFACQAEGFPPATATDSEFIDSSDRNPGDETGVDEETGFGLENETGERPDLCGPYPDGPYAWAPGSIVPPDTVFPARYGSDGLDSSISMAELHENCEEVRSIVFVYGFLS